MNILPKKRWHVRTKENIARVRKDEAEAAEKEKQEKLRIENANREARLNVLKQKSKHSLLQVDSAHIEKSSFQPPSSEPEHINLFADLEHAVTTTNREHDKEAKEKKEEYEKKIGYLTYLGQDTNEALKKKNWYEVLPESRFSQSYQIKDTYEKLILKDPDGKPKTKEIDIKNGEIGWKSKQRLDPINSFKKYCTNVKAIKAESNSSKAKKHDLKKKCKSKKKGDNKEKEKKLLKLREERLKREQREKIRTELLLSGLSGAPSTSEPSLTKSLTVKPKYNSQFNPELARQNFK